ncbi:hypothetical protein [Actinomadura sp. SCN-SB]|uniref:hypothetical protein n=1 Tax=Actinomadura sp. SCN-SB TaxID=3373092 RepID=UPI003751A463
MTAMDPVRMPPGRAVMRVVWLPGSDLLEGTCHCGASYVADGPLDVWAWLLGHPDGHHARDSGLPEPVGAGAVR